MAQKKKKNNMPEWITSKYFLLAAALVIAVLAVVGYKSFAATGAPTYGCSTTPTLKQGSTGNCVKKAQYLLNYACVNPNEAPGAQPFLTVDGVFGTKTTTKTKSFQRATLIGVDGIIGSSTWKNLNYVYNQHQFHSVGCY